MSGTHVENAAMNRATSDAADAGDGGVSVPLTIVEPESAPRGGIVVLHEAHGVTEAVQRLAAALADEGWLAVAPHLYHREAANGDTADGDTAGDGALASLTGATVLEDCDAAFAWLADRGIGADRIGVVGFDLGGAVALVVASSREIGAAVSVSGGGIEERLSEGLPTLVEAAPSLTCPWLGLYGEQDEAISLPQVEALREAAVTSEVATNVVTYAGVGHRFDTEEANSEALQRVFDWFDSHLR